MGCEKTYLLDLDGTMYCGDTLIEGARIFVDWLLASGRSFLFLTNNATRTARQNVAHMEKLGYRGIREEHFFTSAMASARYVARHSKRRRAFVSVPGMARIQSEIDRSQVVTAKCSEPQVVDSDVRDGGSGVAILSSVRTETGYKAKWWIRLLNKPKSKR